MSTKMVVVFVSLVYALCRHKIEELSNNISDRSEAKGTGKIRIYDWLERSES